MTKKEHGSLADPHYRVRNLFNAAGSISRKYNMARLELRILLSVVNYMTESTVFYLPRQDGQV